MPRGMKGGPSPACITLQSVPGKLPLDAEPATHRLQASVRGDGVGRTAEALSQLHFEDGTEDGDHEHSVAPSEQELPAWACS